MGSGISGKNDTKGFESELSKILDRKEILEKITDNSPVIAFLLKAEYTTGEKMD
ncbi:hypothetical protein [Methanolobus psychrotolerans]|uniref:hypothetical protein n=1 Tax=Methanolobus psychrotolerans TaxID=1874706 RepID=UPI0013ECBE03|nr:hypothetical protein [Methanolobus psychrotolerans]